jgi:predicted MPP superfamily phosphohydrolase
MVATNDVYFEFMDSNEKFNLFLIGDIHVGNLGCDLKLLKKVLKSIKETENSYILGMGDYCECITPKDKRYDIHTQDRKILTPKEQYDKIIDLFSPFKGQIIGLLEGNHEASLDKYNSHRITEELAKDLDTVNLGYSAFTDLHFKKIDENGKRLKTTMYTIYATHGTGSGRFKGAKVNRLEQLAQWNESDMYFGAHTHELITWHDIRNKKRGKRKVEDIRIYGITGSFLTGYEKGVTSYVERTQRKPAFKGCLKVEIVPYKRKINSSIFRGD